MHIQLVKAEGSCITLKGFILR